ncbi:MAG TPA: universal stress protein, partial [Streptosporangiaceae bacterium]|nr:universal stress protein [Streptosporangiaceae bacterium]
MTTTEPAGVAEILAVLGHGDDGPVTRTAEVIARLAGGQVRPLRLAADLSPRRAARQVIQVLHQPGTVTGVLSGDELSRPVWQPVAQQSAKPVVLVPAGARRLPRRIRRVLLPLDGTARSAAAVAGTAERFARGGVELVVLHVFDAATVPKFWNQHAHAGQAWEQEFLARYCALPGARLELRSGAAAEHVAKVAGTEQADMIALAWSQRLDPGRAAAVRQTVLDAEVPVMLIPMPADLPVRGQGRAGAASRGSAS